MKKLHVFDSLKIVRVMFVAVACAFILNTMPARADIPAGYTQITSSDTTKYPSVLTGYTKYTITNANWGTVVAGTGGKAYYRYLIDSENIVGSGAQISNMFKRTSIAATNTYVGFSFYYSSAGSDTFVSVRDPSKFTSAESARAYFNEHPLVILVKTTTATDNVYQLVKRDSDGVIGYYCTTGTNAGDFVPAFGATEDTTIKIATSHYNETKFAPVETRLDAAVAAVDTVVTQTMTQAQAIDQIATNKQTRPDEGCPRFKKCLLVEDEQGTPHWYEIYDPINDFLRPILAAAEMSGNQGAPVQITHACGSDSTCYDEYNGFYMGNGEFRQKYIDTSDSTYERPFGPTTLARCADDATRTTSTVNAGICYNTGGMFRELTAGPADSVGEWALVWNGGEGGASLGITPSVVYGVAKCTSVGQHTTEITGDVQSGDDYWWPKILNNYMTSNPTTLASLIEQYQNVETVFNTLPNPVETDDNPENPRANYRNCWCKITAIGVPGSGDDFAEQAANGSTMSVAGGGWVFSHTSASASYCASACAAYCANHIRARAAFRRAVLTVE